MTTGHLVRPFDSQPPFPRTPQESACETLYSSTKSEVGKDGSQRNQTRILLTDVDDKRLLARHGNHLPHLDRHVT
jgi:hypothetical protein